MRVIKWRKIQSNTNKTKQREITIKAAPAETLSKVNWVQKAGRSKLKYND